MSGTQSQAGGRPGGRRTSPVLVEGPIARTLLLFSLPILGSSFLQSLNASINTAWIGRLIGADALSASANANSVMFFLMSAGFGMGMAATILVGQALGARDMDQAKKTIGTTFGFFTIVSLLIAVLGFVFAPHMLVAMGTPGEALPLASAYLRVIFLALPSIYLYTFAMMALRGAGDARTPFIFMAISAVLDVAFNPLLILGVGPIPPLGIAGSALATLISQWIGLLALVGWLYRSGHFLTIRRGELGYLKLDGDILRALVVKGLPMSLQLIVMSSSMLAMITLVNRYGALTVAAYGACFQLWSYIQMPAMAVGNAVSSMAAQNVGAGRWDRVSRITVIGVLYNILLTGALVLLVTLVDRGAYAIFLGADSPAVDIARHIHDVASWSFILFGIAFVLSSVVRSTGAVFPPLIFLFIAMWVVRLPFAYLLSATMGADAIWWSFPMGSGTSAILLILYYRLGGWKRARMLQHSPLTAVPAEA
ncbi:MAG TPA: MATE family efflux transporter [Alphaproteobacteria bacterium]|nr:MATE family efflux transporter [Alphaproteobacteria bacterium]